MPLEPNTDPLDPTTTPFPTSASAGMTTGTAGTDPTNSAQHRFIERVVQGAHEAIDKAARVAVPAVDRLSDQARRATVRVNERADQLGTLQDQWVQDCRTTVRQHPLAAVATGVALGWLIGRLTAR